MPAESCDNRFRLFIDQMAIRAVQNFPVIHQQLAAAWAGIQPQNIDILRENADFWSVVCRIGDVSGNPSLLTDDFWVARRAGNRRCCSSTMHLSCTACHYISVDHVRPHLSVGAGQDMGPGCPPPQTTPGSGRCSIPADGLLLECDLWSVPDPIQGLTQQLQVSPRLPGDHRP